MDEWMDGRLPDVMDGWAALKSMRRVRARTPPEAKPRRSRAKPTRHWARKSRRSHSRRTRPRAKAKTCPAERRERPKNEHRVPAPRAQEAVCTVLLRPAAAPNRAGAKKARRSHGRRTRPRAKSKKFPAEGLERPKKHTPRFSAGGVAGAFPCFAVRGGGPKTGPPRKKPHERRRAQNWNRHPKQGQRGLITEPRVARPIRSRARRATFRIFCFSHVRKHNGRKKQKILDEVTF